MIFYYDGGYVALRNPELGDTHSLRTYAVNRETIGGEVKSVKDAGWPNKEMRTFSFSNLKKTTKEDFEAILIASAGEQIKITDHNNEVWEGVVISNPMDIITQRDTNCGSYEVSFELMGVNLGAPEGLFNTDEEQIYNTDEEPVYAI